MLQERRAGQVSQVERGLTARSVMGIQQKRSLENQRSPSLIVQPRGEVAQGL